jgi:hypothetical protein
MKKLMFVVSLCLAIVFANAQEQKSEIKEVKKLEKSEKAVQIPTKVKVAEAELLPVIKDNIAKDYAGAKIERSFRVDAKGVVTYEIHILKDNAKMFLVYDKDGRFIKKEDLPRMRTKSVPLKVEGTREMKKDLKVDEKKQVTPAK